MSTPSVAWPELKWRRGRWAAVYLGLWTGVGLAFAGQHFLTSAKVGAPVGWPESVVSSLTDWYVFAALAVPAIQLARRFNLAGPQWGLRLSLHLVASAVFSLLWILIRAALGELLRLRGAGRSFGEVLQYVIVATFFFNVLVYWVVITGTHAVAYARSLRERSDGYSSWRGG